MRPYVAHSKQRIKLCIALAAIAACPQALAQAPAMAALHIVLVLDGLRPGSITARDTPNLLRLKTEGVAFTNSHAVFPTVTRVNATALATGSYPARNGIMGNSVYIPAVDPRRAFTNDDAQKLLRLKDRIVTAPGLADALKAAGERYVAVSSGSTGKRATACAERAARPGHSDKRRILPGRAGRLA